MRRAALLAALVLAGCASQPAPLPVAQPYEVKVPVYIKPKAPDSLLLRYVPTELPRFVSPTAPNVVYGLTQEDWNRLQTLLRTLHTRDQAWRSWATGQGEPND